MPRGIWVELPRTAYYTGEVVEGTVVVETTSEIPTRGVDVEFIGREQTQIERGSGDNHRVYRSVREHVAWRLPLQGPGAVPPGTQRLPFRFQIPLETLPSYEGKHAKMTYLLSARIDVPLWLDTTWSGEVFVFYDRRTVRHFAQPVRIRSGGDGPEVYVELDGDRHFARELIGCRVTLARFGDIRVRRVYFRLVGSEWAKADGAEETTKTFEREWSVPSERIRLGVPFEYELPIPSEIQSAYRGTHSHYAYLLQVGVDIAWGFDLVVETPIVLVR